jgi:hypothetical protein
MRSLLAAYAYWLAALCAALVAIGIAVCIAVVLRRRVDAPVDAPNIIDELLAPTGRRSALDTAEWRPAHRGDLPQPQHSRSEHNARWRPDNLVTPTEQISADTIRRAIGDRHAS